jgi:HemY protein
MRAALWILVLFAAAVAFTLAARLDQGYVIIVYPPWRMELSFMLALLLLAGLVALAYVGMRLANVALNLSGDVRAWREKRRQTKADKALMDAMRAHLDGDFKRAAELAGKAGDSTLAPDLAERLRQPVSVDSVPAPVLTKTETQTPTPTA